MTKGVRELKIFKAKNDYTQDDLAKLTGVNRNTIASIEAGINQPSVKTAKEIAEKTGIEWHLFFEEEEKK